jgi:acetylornithine deacetylase/succinyl-diaminopimelate desuccinylase family protein
MRGKEATVTGAVVTELLAEMAEVDTTNPGGQEVECLGVLTKYFARHGLHASVEKYTEDPSHANLVVSHAFGPGPVLLLNSHIDVVPAGGGWTHPPFSPTIVHGVMYGRGVADAKGCLAAMAVALATLVEDADLNVGTVVYTAVGDEEVGSSGVSELLTTVGADACVVGEPTGLKALNAHKGSVRPVVEVKGLPAHAATPERGVNAIEWTSDLLRRARGLQSQLQDRDAGNPYGTASLTPVLIEGGEAPNAVPEYCRVTFDRRLLPGESAESALAQLEEMLEEFNLAARGAHAKVDHLAPSTGGSSLTPPGDRIVTAAQAALAAHGLDDDLGCLQVNCDMASFVRKGIPSVILGPGALEVMHAIDEKISLDELATAVDVYRSVILGYLTSSEAC